MPSTRTEAELEPQRPEHPGLYPLFLKLDGRRVLLVGAGKVAHEKLGGLLHVRASITVVALEASEAVVEMAAAGQIVLERRAFQDDDVQGRALVIAATNDADVNERIMRASRDAGVLVNVVDDANRSDFYLPSVLRRGRLQIAVSTGGASPGFSRALKGELERLLSRKLDEYVEILAEARLRIRRSIADPDRRREAHQAMVACGARQLVEAGDAAGALRAVEQVLLRYEGKQSEP